MGDNISTVEDSFSTVEVVQYSGGIALVTARDIYSLLILSNQLQIHENAIEIGLNLKQGFKCAKYPIVLDHSTYVSHWKDK